MFRVGSIVIVACLLVLAPFSQADQHKAIADPTRPDAWRSARASTATTYRLSSVLIGSERKLATINGKVYSEGDRMALGRLVAIREDSVVIQGAKRHELKMGAKTIRRH